MIAAIIPVKALPLAKSRLGALLSGPERRAVLGDRPDIEATSVPLDPANPARVRIVNALATSAKPLNRIARPPVTNCLIE